MTNEELRKACELADLKWRPANDARDYAIVMNRNGYAWKEMDPALPAYVASLLVARLTETTLGQIDDYRKALATVNGSLSLFADDEQRIRAAVAALGEGE